MARAQGGECRLGIARDDRAPSLARGKRRDQPALRRFIIDKHEKAWFDIRHLPAFCLTSPCGRTVIRQSGKDGLKPTPKHAALDLVSMPPVAKGGLALDRGSPRG